MRLGLGMRIGEYILRVLSGAIPSSTLLNGLVSYWPLDEISGVRYDAVGSNDLTDNNTVGAVLRGPEGTVAKTVYANSEYLGRTQTLDYSLGVTASIWFYQATGANVQGRFLQHGGAYYYGGTGTFSLTDGNSTPNLYAGVGDNASIVNATTQSSGLNAWHHVVMWYDPSDKKVRMRLDGQTAVASASGLANHPDPAAGLYNDFVIGRETVVGVYTDALFGPTALWNRLLTTDEQTALFAAGNAARYADVDVGASCIGWWELDEVSGVRYDSHGSNDLTDNNTVGSATAVSGAMDGAAASFVEANSEYLDISAGAIPVNSDFTVTFWGWHNDTAGNIAYFPFKTKTTSADQHGIFLEASWSGNHRMYNRRAYGTAVELGDNAGKWVLYLYEYNHATTTTRCMALGSAANSGVWSADSVADLGAATTYFSLLRNEAGVGSVLFRVDEVALWSRVLTADERTELYNLGRGKYYDFS